MPDDDANPTLHVGDHVSDRYAGDDSDDTATMLVKELHAARASQFDIGDGRTVADVNPAWPEDDKVVSVIYPQRSDMDLPVDKPYAFPRSRLKLETPIHDRDDAEGES